MEKFPQPPPDRRLNRKSSQPQMQMYNQGVNKQDGNSNVFNTSNLNFNNKINLDKTNNNIGNSNYLDFYKSQNNNTFESKKDYNNSKGMHVIEESISNMDLIKQKNIEDMRKQIDNFEILSDKKMFLNFNYNNLDLNFTNFVLFGPSGSGKSSFIRTLFKSLYATKNLPPNIIDSLIIKNSYENEGTLRFTRMILKEDGENKTGIRICDTRGHILMNKEEKEQFKLIVEGRVKDNVQVIQSSSRNPFLLWEFWKKDEQLFSQDIFSKEPPSINALPHSVILVFDGSSEDIINPDEVEFYRDLVSMCLAKGYADIHVILTRVDILEEMVYKRKGYNNSKENIQNLVHSVKDQQIEKVIECLGVKRSNVHFIENYLSEKFDNSVEIDYHVLKSLNDMLNSAEQFLLMYYNKNTTCFSKCF